MHVHPQQNPHVIRPERVGEMRAMFNGLSNIGNDVVSMLSDAHEILEIAAGRAPDKHASLKLRAEMWLDRHGEFIRGAPDGT